ncbi:MAG: hypothetical protein Q4D16_07755 [Eubacteriales bacterium]|nr:hypothetical protein [Eubacteriales bacterium]
MRKRLVALVLGIMMCFGTTSVVMADYADYYTNMNNYDYSPSLRKINDTNPVDHNTYCIYTSSGNRSGYYTSVWANKSYRMTEAFGLNSGGRISWFLPKRDDGYIQLRLENPHSSKITVSGRFWLYP